MPALPTGGAFFGLSFPGSRLSPWSQFDWRLRYMRRGAVIQRVNSLRWQSTARFFFFFFHGFVCWSKIGGGGAKAEAHPLRPSRWHRHLLPPWGVRANRNRRAGQRGWFGGELRTDTSLLAFSAAIVASVVVGEAGDWHGWSAVSVFSIRDREDIFGCS